MSTPWTAGPWKLDDQFRVLADDERHTIIHVPPCSWTNCEAQADARLISAAPELAAALDDLLSSLKVLFIEGLTEEMKIASAALAKARGEQ